jgi:hypothetical protein
LNFGQGFEPGGRSRLQATMLILRSKFLLLVSLFAAGSFMNSAAAQVVIPHGDYDSDFEKYLVVAVSLAALVFAVWRYWGSRR